MHLTFVELLLLSFALAMDCFTVSLTCGILQRRMGRQVWAMAFLFGLFQAMMPLIGWLLVDALSESITAYDHWIAFGLLSFLGGKMIVSAFRSEVEPSIRPSDLRSLVVLSFATSIDAMAVGLSFPGMGIVKASSLWLPLLVIGIGSFTLSIVGKYIGVTIGRRLTLPAEPVGGLILILIGIKVLITHLS